MKRKICLVVALMLVFALTFVIPVKSQYVYASDDEITKVEVEEKSGKMIVSGKVQGNILAVAIAVYDESGENLVIMKTTAVDDENEFYDVIEIKNGSYLVKVANYEGGAFVEKKVTLSDEDTDVKDLKDTKNKSDEETKVESKKATTNPLTGNNVLIIAIVLVVAVVILGISFVVSKKIKLTLLIEKIVINKKNI